MFARVTSWIRECFHDPLQDCHQAQPRLNELAAELDAIAVRINHHETDGINEITGYFQMVYEMMQSGLVDRAGDELAYVDYDRYATVIKGLRELQLHLEDDARHFVPMNQAPAGQPITDTDIVLTNVEITGTSTRLTMNIHDIKTRRGDVALYNSMNRAAIQVMQRHIGRMLAIIHEFNRVMGSPQA